MSFSYDVKTELCAVKVKERDLKRAELAGIVMMGGSITINSRGVALGIATEHESVVKRVMALIENVYGVNPELKTRTQQLKKKTTYIIEITGYDNVISIMEDIGLKLSGGISCDDEKFAVITDTEKKGAALIRGAFLATGSVSDPNKIYHLEFVVNLQDFANCLLNTINEWNLNAKTAYRKQSCIVYIKDIENIIRILTLIGAHKSVLELENIRILKDIRNNVNRQVNCDNANMDKTISSAQQQIANINLIAEKIGLINLPDKLRETAELRLNNPEASLKELAAISENTSRSGINHRLRKITEIAEQLSEAKEI